MLLLIVLEHFYWFRFPPFALNKCLFCKLYTSHVTIYQIYLTISTFKNILMLFFIHLLRSNTSYNLLSHQTSPLTASQFSPSSHKTQNHTFLSSPCQYLFQSMPPRSVAHRSVLTPPARYLKVPFLPPHPAP